MKWYKAVVHHKGRIWYYTLKAPDLLTAANMVLVHVECGVECLMKVKEVRVSEAMQQIIDLNPGRNIFCRGEKCML